METNKNENSVVVTEYKSEQEFYNVRKQERVFGNFISSIKTELSENSKKGDWLNFTDWQKINDEIYYHRQKLDDAMNEGNLDKIKEHIADVSGLYMMLGNSYGLYNKPNKLTVYDTFKLKTWIADLHKVKIKWISLATHLRNGTHDKEKQEQNLIILFHRIENLTGLKISKEEYDNIKTFGQLLEYLKPFE